MHLIIGPTPELFNYVLHRDTRGIIVALFHEDASPDRVGPTLAECKPIEHKRWRREFPWRTNYHRAQVRMAITSDRQSDQEESLLVTLPGHEWDRSAINCGGFGYFLNDGDRYPLLIASIGGAVASDNGCFTLSPSTITLHVSRI